MTRQPAGDLVEVPILALAGLPVAGVIAQVRQAPTEYDTWTSRPVEGWEPLWRVLETVEIKQDRTGYGTPKVPWVFWRWQSEGGRASDCGYSGITVDLAERGGRTLLMAAGDAARLLGDTDQRDAGGPA